MKIVALFIGYKIVRVGSELLRDGVKGEFKFNSDIHGFKADLVSVSPGLLFVLIGGLIVGIALFVDKKVDYGSKETVVEQTSSSTKSTDNDNPPPEVDTSLISKESNK